MTGRHIVISAHRIAVGKRTAVAQGLRILGDFVLILRQSSSLCKIKNLIIIIIQQIERNKLLKLLHEFCVLGSLKGKRLLRNHIVCTFAKSLDYIYWQPSVQSVEVYLNGAYHGVYLLCEQVEVNKNKVNISEDLTAAQVAFLVMFSGYTDTSDFYSFTLNASTGSQKFEIKSDLSEGAWLAEQQKQYIIDYINSCWKAVESGNQSQIEALIDVNSIIDTYIVHELFKNLDTGWDNFYMYKNLDGKLCYGPVWDFDQCAGNADEGIDDPTGLRGGNTQQWYAQLLEHSWFQKKLQSRWYELKNEINAIPQLIISTAEDGYSSYCRNFDKWKIFGYKINRETVLSSAARATEKLRA